MTPTERGFLDDIIENPDDDTPRLVYADWLEDGGRAERARFIRWACANPQNSAVCLCLNGARQPQPCEVCQMMGDEIRCIPRRADGESHYVLNRGFVREVRCPLQAWLDHDKAICAVHPIKEVRLTDKKPHKYSVMIYGWGNEADKLMDHFAEHSLPSELWDALSKCPNGTVKEYDDSTWVDFCTKETAVAALSSVLIERARKK